MDLLLGKMYQNDYQNMKILIFTEKIVTLGKCLKWQFAKIKVELIQIYKI